jgi:hypothetical protein
VHFFPAIPVGVRYWAVLRVLNKRCIRDFFRAAAFFFITPFPAAESIFLIISLSADSASLASFFLAKRTNFFALVLTELFTALFRFLRSSLCLCRFSADLPLLIIKKTPSYLKSEGRLSTRLHFSHSAWFLTFPFSKSVFILISPPQEQKNFCVALVVREFLLA